MNNLTPLYLTNEEAVRFVKFQKFYFLVKALEDMNVNDLKNGSLTIHFDNLGRIRLVERNESFRYLTTEPEPML